MDFKQFFSQLKGKKIAMCGIGVSNTPLILNFLKQGARVIACDRRERALIGSIADELEAAGAELKLGEDYLSNLEVDIIFRTPGMNFHLPELERARKRGIAVTSEMEVFFDLCPATIFAVTGSDGKTTTTTLIAKMLEAEGKRVVFTGDLKAGMTDYPTVITETDVDLVVTEGAHTRLNKPEVIEILGKSRTKKLIVSHRNSVNPDAIVAELAAALADKFPVVTANDNDVFEV